MLLGGLRDGDAVRRRGCREIDIAEKRDAQSPPWWIAARALTHAPTIRRARKFTAASGSPILSTPSCSRKSGCRADSAPKSLHDAHVPSYPRNAGLRPRAEQRLRQAPRERLLADAGRPGEEIGVRDPVGSKRTEIALRTLGTDDVEMQLAHGTRSSSRLRTTANASSKRRLAGSVPSSTR